MGVRRLGLVVLAAALLAAVASEPAAESQALPPPPEENPLAPVAPTLSEACGLVNTAASLIPLATSLVPGAEVPPELLQLLGPLTTVCAFVPAPPAPRECALDTDIFLALKPLADSLSLPVLVEPSLAARIADQLAAVELLLPAGGPGVAALLDGVARCSVPGPASAPTIDRPATGAPPPAGPPSPPSAAPASPVPRVPPRTLPSLAPAPRAPVPAPSGPAGQQAPTAPVQLVSEPSPIDHGRYRVILIAPLFLAASWFVVGRSLAPIARRRAGRAG